MNWYLGDRALDFFLIVAIGVALLSSAAWFVAWRLPRRPATRHLVLVSALFCCLGMPLLALAFTASGWTLIAIPILPARDADRARVMAAGPRIAVAPQQLATPTGNGRFSPETEALKSEATEVEPGSFILHPSPFILSPVAGVAAGSAGKPPGVPDRERAAHPNAWSARYRAAATLVLIAWGCGTALLLLNLARNYWLIRRLCRASSEMGAQSLQLVVDDVGRLLGVRRLPRVVVSRRAMTPFAVGFRRPIVVLPERLMGEVSLEEMRDVFVHEVAHIRRRDQLIVLLQELARALYWPIVTIHGLIRELGQAREELCDNHVLRSRDALSYGETLLHLAELSWEARPMGATVGILHWKGALERRIAGLLDQRRSTMTGNSCWLTCLVVLVFIGGGTIASVTRFIATEVPGDPASGGAQAPATRKPDPDDAAKKVAVDAKPKPAAKRSMLIHVVGPDGRPMAGVNVHRSVVSRKPGNVSNLDQVTDPHGQVRFELPQGIEIYRLWVRAKGHVPLFAGWEEQDNPEESLPEELTFRLERGTVIGGIIQNVDGKPIAGVRLEVRLGHGGERYGRVRPDMGLAESNAAPTTDAQGRWTLDTVPAGDDVRVSLKLAHPDYVADPNWGTLQMEQDVEMPALRARTATITMQRGLTVTGTVTDPDGKPIAGAVVVRGEEPYRERGSQEVRTDAHGVYRSPPLARGPLTITAIAPSWMPMQKKVDLQPGMKPVDFHVEPGKELRIRFIDRLGQPISGVGVMIDKWRGNEALYNNRHHNVLNTQIPNQAGEAGLYQWTWAPDDAVTYTFRKKGYANRQAALVADGKEETITLQAVLRITGKVTDAATGRLIDKVTAIPVLEFSPGNLLVERQRKKAFPGGVYTVEGDRADNAYRVRVEAEGYRSAMSDAFRVGAFRPTFDFRLELAPTVRGRVVNAHGQPVAGARVYLATASQILGIENQREDDWLSNQKAVTDGQGGFSFPAQFERCVLIAIHDAGYAEVSLEPDQQPGELALRAWARVEGRLMQAGQPVPSAWIVFKPLRLHLAASPHIQDGISARTDRAGRFVFPRVPPMKSAVRADWRQPQVISSPSVPLNLRPGQRIEVDLGDAGTLVTGRVVPSGDLALKLDFRKSRTDLMCREPGIELPAEFRSLGFNVRRGYAGLGTREARDSLQARYHAIAGLDRNGRFQISGVPAGDYDFAIALYQPPEDGCLVSTVGTKIVRVQVTEEVARKGTLDLGDITVAVKAGPRPGEVVPDLAFTAFSGETVNLGDLRGRYVLLNFWATWCIPCVDALPAVRKLHDTYGAGNRLMVLGLNLDEDPAKARQFVQEHPLPWAQGPLGGRTDDPVLARYAVSSVPAYFLIGPDGRLIQSGQSVEEIAEVLHRRLR